MIFYGNFQNNLPFLEEIASKKYRSALRGIDRAFIFPVVSWM